MDLEILSGVLASQYIPRNSTYAIQIHSGMLPPSVKLQNSSLYTIREYVFDDVDPYNGDTPKEAVVLDELLVRLIITDFTNHGLGKETLLVHCSRGINRSPAVAIALNERFNLGHDTLALKNKFSYSNWYVYDMILNVK